MKLIEIVHKELTKPRRPKFKTVEQVAMAAVAALNDAFADVTHKEGELVDDVYNAVPFSFETNGEEWLVRFKDAPVLCSEDLTYRDEEDEESVVNLFLRNLEYEMRDFIKLVLVVKDGAPQ